VRRPALGNAATLKFVDRTLRQHRTLRQQVKLAADAGKRLPKVFDRNSFFWTVSGGHRIQTLSDRFPVCSMSASGR